MRGGLEDKFEEFLESVKSLQDKDSLIAVRAYSLLTEVGNNGVQHDLSLKPLPEYSHAPGLEFYLGRITLSPGTEKSPLTGQLRLNESGIYTVSKEIVSDIWNRLLDFISEQDAAIPSELKNEQAGWRKPVSVSGISYFSKFLDRRGISLFPRIPSEVEVINSTQDYNSLRTAFSD